MSVAAERLLVVDDDQPFRERIARSLRLRGFAVCEAGNVDEALEALLEFTPEFALVDLKMPGAGGLELVAALRTRHPDARIVVLTGYGSIATAMEAVRLGAADYLTKPADADQICAALRGEKPQVPENVPTLDRVEWEHLQRVLADCGNNITHAARALGIDRRSLQRKLAKYPPLR